MNRTLALAVHHWLNDRALPVTLTTKLTNLGYDVPALAARYGQ